MNLFAEITSHLDALIGLGGVAIGAVIVLVSTYFAHFLQQRAETRRMASAFAAEISAVLEVAKARQIKEALQGGLQLYQSGGHWTSFSWPISDDYFRVYRGNVDKIGLFEPSLASKIATFYTFCFAVVEGVTAIEKMDLKNKEFIIHSLTSDLELVERVERLGNELIPALESTAL